VTPIVGRGWATVELARAEAELCEHGRIGAFEQAERCSWLGARCHRARVVDAERADGDWVVVLEPDTEGRLAAFLARHGEGWAVTWTTDAGATRHVDPRPGPLGPEVLASGGPTSGPFRLLVSAATIES
jgi:hypothetical protein